jgi:acetyl esterase/lipase
MTIKQHLLIAGLFFMTITANAQAVKYKDMVFSGVKTTLDLSYDENDAAGKNKGHLFDFYQAEGDKSTDRPLIIWMHGGGFMLGSKADNSARIWSKTFAQRGYVCASINYTLSSKLPAVNFNQLKIACYYAVLDAKRAVAYFKQHAAEYHINPDKIILGGNSAGGMIALQAACATEAELAKFAGLPASNSNDKELLKVAGVINLWGAIFNLDWLKNARVPVVNIYGSTDSIVPPTHKDAPLYGGKDIYAQAKVFGLITEEKVFEGYSHELRKHFNPIFASGEGTRQRWLQAGQFAADFLYKNLFK